MTTTEKFNRLAERFLAGEASADERAALHALVAKDAKLREEFHGLQEAAEFIEDLAVIHEAVHAPPEEPPPHRVREFQQMASNTFEAAPTPGTGQAVRVFLAGVFDKLRQGTRPGWALAAVILVVTIGVATLWKTDHERSRTASNGTLSTQVGIAAEMRSLLSLPTDRFLASIFAAKPPSVNRSLQPIPIYSPSSSTRALQPLILWQSQPGKKYDVTITDQLDERTPPWQIKAVDSPLDFAKVEAWRDRPLAVGSLYQLRIQERARAVLPTEITETTFRVLPGAVVTRATSSQEKLHTAQQALTTEPVCFGDALAELMTLGPEAANSELALKLKVAIFHQLGFRAEYEGAIEQLKMHPASPKR